MASPRTLTPPANPFNFIKIVLSYNIQSKGLRLPEKFTETHGKNLLNWVTLKLPDDRVWQVGLVKSEGEIWLKNGWREFAEYYSLEYGHLLLFKYEGYSIFTVIIFDVSASEIVYPENKNVSERIPMEDSTRKKAGKRPVFSKEVNLTELKTVKSEEETEDEEVAIGDGGECSRKRKDGRRRSMVIERVKANFKSEKPFFMVHMTPSYTTGRTGLMIPLKFIEKHWSGYKKHSKCLLQVANDERGEGHVCEAVANNCSLGANSWKMFVNENGISVGDVCVFELIDQYQNVLKVSIFRAAG